VNLVVKKRKKENEVEQHYKAKWGTSLKITSVLASLLMISATVPICWLVPIGWVKLYVLALGPGVIIPAALFIIRGYTLTENELLIQRLLWKTRIPLQGLVSAQVAPDALRACIRTCGNGGLFSFTGYYYSKPLGHFRAFVTDLKTPVVLRFEKRTIVVSPSEPEAFVKVIGKGLR